MVLDKKVLSLALLLFAGMLTIYVSLLAATDSVAQTDDQHDPGITNPGDPDETDEPGETSTIEGVDDVVDDDLADAENALIGGEETIPLSVDQEIEADAESGDAIPDASVYNTGDGSAVCAPVQQIPVTGNQQTGQGNVGIGSEDEVIFGGPEMALAPEQNTACAQTIQPSY